MDRRTFLAGAASTVALQLLGSGRLRADEILDADVRKAIDKGLDWLAGQQFKDGHWEGQGGQWSPPMTAIAGMSLLMEGSTMREGKFADRIRRAVDWLVDRVRPNGLIADPRSQIEAQRYMYGHGFGMLFLASVYGEEEDGDRRKKLEDVLTRAVDFCGKAQNSKGGWGYVSAADGNDFAEGSVTVTQMQGLRAARNAGIPVPKSVIDKARDYLEKCTFPDGQVGYYIGRRAITPGLTSAGVACMFNAGEYSSPVVKKWLNYCQSAITPLGSGGGRAGHDEYTHYYYAQCIYILGEEGYAKLYPDSKISERLTWSKYRAETFQHMVKSQNADGTWNSGTAWFNIGPVYVTAVYLAILQLDKGTLPIYQR